MTTTRFGCEGEEEDSSRHIPFILRSKWIATLGSPSRTAKPFSIQKKLLARKVDSRGKIYIMNSHTSQLKDQKAFFLILTLYRPTRSPTKIMECGCPIAEVAATFRMRSANDGIRLLPRKKRQLLNQIFLFWSVGYGINTVRKRKKEPNHVILKDWFRNFILTCNPLILSLAAPSSSVIAYWRYAFNTSGCHAVKKGDLRNDALHSSLALHTALIFPEIYHKLNLPGLPRISSS